MRTAAGLISLSLGVGFGTPALIGARHLAQTGEVWTFMGFPTYGGGPFGRIGLATSAALLLAFALVCVAEVALGVALVVDVQHAKAMAVALLPFELTFWIGLALPFGPILGLARTALLFL